MFHQVDTFSKIFGSSTKFGEAVLLHFFQDPATAHSQSRNKKQLDVNKYGRMWIET